MKRILFALAIVLVSTAAMAQDDLYRKSQKEETQKKEMKINKEIGNHIYNAGVLMKKSATYDVGAWAFTIASGVAFSDILFDNKDTRTIVGAALAAGALACKIASVTFKSKAGTELKLAPGKVSVTF